MIFVLVFAETFCEYVLLGVLWDSTVNVILSPKLLISIKQRLESNQCKYTFYQALSNTKGEAERLLLQDYNIKRKFA